MASIKVIDRGLDALVKKIAKAKKAQVSVGIFADGKGSDSEQGGPLSVLEVATFHEFGLGVPERSFLRGYVDENQERIRGMIRSLAQLIAQGKTTPEEALDKLGLKLVGEIQKRIADRIDPPLAASTIARKGSDVPLIDTGQLRSSITHKVEGVK